MTVLGGACFTRQLVAAACLLFALAFGAVAEDSAAGQLPLEQGILRSSSGRFLVIGADGLTRMHVAHWCEEVADRVSRLVGMSDDPENARCAVVLHTEELPKPRVVRQQWISENTLVQRLHLHMPAHVDVGESERALTGLWLGRAIFLAGEGVTNSAACHAPEWMEEGVQVNLFPGRRREARRAALDAWRGGQLSSLRELISEPVGASQDGAGGLSETLRRAQAGMLVAWLQARSPETGCLKELLRLLARGGRVTPSVLSALMGVDDDLETRWQEWVASQRDVVDVPGQVTADVLARLRAALLLSPGESGIPESIDDGPIAWSSLFEYRKEEWLEGFWKQKCTELRVLSIGRGPEFRRVVELYCRFLEELGEGRSDRKLDRYLEEAESALKRLQTGGRDADGGQ